MSTKFNISLIGKFWLLRDSITKSIHFGNYIIPRILNNKIVIEETIENNDINAINYYNIEMEEKSENNNIGAHINYSTYKDIFNSLFNESKINEYAKKCVIGLILEMKFLINSEDDKK